MSVNACDRSGCTSVMCDHLSSRYGYLCNSCLKEAENSNINEYTIATFMQTPPIDESIIESNRLWLLVEFMPT